MRTRVSPTAEAEAFLSTLFESVKHGDAEHQAWLKAELMKHTDALASLLRRGGW